MIQMKSGVYGGKVMKRPEDGPFSLSAAEEARLVSRGVAKYVDGSAVAANAAQTMPIDEMTAAELRALGKDHGLTFRVGMTKAAMAEAIKAKLVEVPDRDDEATEEDPAQENVEETEAPEEDAPTFDAAEAVQ